ncbi:putative secreted protein [Echria macrotheca]|uniref:Secreted protein n=1 Tax=Echria macrotheca TaxID=438768 RepID=A0AAJ0B172_9PEZI|nr:putative secreted protein [Echria macrotheca]
MAAILKLFRRKKPAPLVCSVGLDVDSPHEDHQHHHTAACFLPFESLAVLEFFQSQGCQSCPPAIPGILEGALQQPNIVLLSYNVTLFDHLGWADTLADSRWDARQRAYARAWGRNNLYTPMVVANGSVDGTGTGGRQDIADIVARSREVNAGSGWKVYLDVNDTDVRIDSDRGMEADGDVYDVVLTVYDPRSQTVKVKSGTNKGKKIEHRNVVTDSIKVGEWRGGDVTLPLPMSKAGLPHGHEAVVFLQIPAGGRIVAAAKL